MIKYFASLDHYIQTLIATLFTWGVTALGATLVVFLKTIKKVLWMQC